MLTIDGKEVMSQWVSPARIIMSTQCLLLLFYRLCAHPGMREGWLPNSEVCFNLVFRIFTLNIRSLDFVIMIV